MAAAPVNIVLPSGEGATVAPEELEQALAAGASLPSSPATGNGSLLGMLPSKETLDEVSGVVGLLGGGLGALANPRATGAAVLGAARTATFGLSDAFLGEGANVLSGEQARKETLGAIDAIREANPIATGAGELGGLFIGAGEGVTALGEAAERGVSARLGGGLLGEIASMSARGAVESTLLGAQHQITEDTLGDHEYNAEALFSNAAKEGLLGGGLGGGLGLLGHIAGRARGLAGRPGPLSSRALDEIAGVAGAGRGVREAASRSEAAVDGIRRTGATSEQATQLVDELETMGKARARAVFLDREALDAGLYGDFETGRALLPDGSTDYLNVTRRVPLSDIDVPPVWDSTKMGPLRAAREAGTELDPIKIGRMAEDESWSIVDGIHRANLAAERGEKDILARATIETSPQRLNDDVFDLRRPTTEAAPIRFGEPPPAARSVPNAGLVAPSAPTRTTGAGLIDSAAERYAVMHGGERGDLIRRHYADSAKHALDAETVLDEQARKLADAGTKAMRGLEDTANQVHFTERPEQFARLLDPSNYNAARDAVVSMGQDVRALVGELDMLPTKGGVDVGVSRIGRQLKEFDAVINHLPTNGGVNASRDAYMAAYRLKQAVGKYAGFGKPPHLRTPGENALSELYETLRVGLEDEAAFGAAGAANREWNAAFADDFGRRRDFGNRFAVSIDEVSGVPRPEIDAGKMKGFLRQVGGAEADQSVKSIESTIDWMRARASKIEQYAALTPAQENALASGRAALDEFQKVFRDAQKEAAIANRLRSATLEEKGAGLGGLLGLLGDTVTRPLETVRRLGQIRQGVDSFENSVKRMVRGFAEAGNRVGEPAMQASPRPRNVTVNEFESIRELASNPMKMQAAIDRMVGDLDKHAPRTAEAYRAAAMRTLLYLAREAPAAMNRPMNRFEKTQAKPRYSDLAVHDWETKRNAALDPKSVVNDMKRGVLHREALEAVQATQPRAFRRIQELADAELDEMRRRGVLVELEYSKRAPFATLLGIPVDETWTPEFMATMQAARAASPAEPPAGAGRLPRKSNQKPLADQFMTAAARIESEGEM